MIPNGAGGFLVAWQDDREMGSVFIQNINRIGSPLWMPDGISPCHLTTEESGAALVSDSEGGTIVAWVDARSAEGADIYAQRIKSDGTIAWQPNGMPICTAAGDQWRISMCADGAGGAVIAWWDSRAACCGIYAQRVDALGMISWRANGVAVCGVASFNPYFMHPVAMAVPDGERGIVIAWEDYRAIDIASVVYAQRLDGLGNAIWQEDGIPVCDAPPGQWSPAVVPDESHGAIIAWHDFRAGNSSGIYAQRLGAGGERLWGDAGVPVCVEIDDQFEPQAVPDGAGGAVIAWIDLRTGTSHDIYAQRLSAAGEIVWHAVGVPLCAAPLRQSNPTLVSDGAGGAIAAWHDFRSGHETDIKASKVAGDGSLPWQPDGIPVCTTPGSQRYPAAVSDGEGGAFFAWQDARAGDGCWDIYAQRAGANGQPLSTLLLSHETSIDDGEVVVRWTLSERLPESSFEIARSEAGSRMSFAVLSAAPRRSGVSSYVFRDGSAEAGKTYRYCVAAATGVEGAFEPLFETGPVRVPLAKLALNQNYPNPFSSVTAIEYNVPSSMAIDISVFTCNGGLVAKLYRGVSHGGRHATAWNGKRADGAPAEPGVYYCTLKSDRGRLTKKIILVR